MLDFYWLTTHRHLILFLEDLCMEIRILRLTPILLLVVNPHNHAINISISYYLIFSYDMVNSYDLKDQIIFQTANKVIWTSIDSHQLNNFIYVIHYISRVRIVTLDQNLTNQYTLTTISTRCFLSWKYYILITLSHHCTLHLTHQYTIQLQHIF